MTMPLAEAAARLNLTRSKAYDELLLGKLGTPSRLRGRWYVDAEAVERLAAERTTTPSVVNVANLPVVN